MSKIDLQNIEDIKIPYPTEGIVRTAQLDDTIAPTNSVQLAVNMNFDRVGALQTRPGVTEYADSLVEQINNFGTLRNSIIPPGYLTLFQMGTTETLASDFTYPSAVKVSNTKIAVFWTGAGSIGVCQNFTIDEDNGNVTPLGTPVTFDATLATGNKAILVSSSVVLNVWTGSSNDGKAKTFDVSDDTIVPQSSALNFDSTTASSFTLSVVDASHVICFYASDTSGDGVATIFEINFGTGAVTEPGSPLTFISGPVADNSCQSLGDGIHFINFWYGPTGAAGSAQVFSVNTGTWAITALSSPLTTSSHSTQNNAMSVGDGQHFVNIFRGATSSRAEAQAFSVNLSTFAVTAVGTPVLISATPGNTLTAVGFGDGYHFVAFFASSLGTGFVQMVEMDSLTFDMSLVGPLLTGYDFANFGYTSPIQLTTNKVLVAWGNVGGVTGEAAMFESLGTPVDGRWLYAGYSTSVANTSDGTWVDRRTGLATVSKPRFAQFLNYIWMVNGNEFLGGDPVATSDGGAFGTTLVPDNFPKGDFIHAGFEGRVWVADRTLGIIYYTDIVQFAPPNIYTLTFNAEVNFITTISPQAGQEITALYRVPRALLVFTQDTITRIYGASSIDAYPAYNVGTFSQESIIETKTGIFFHHSSGFYQFDYGSQPVEISRRIIDFVKAIPRSAYEDITGVYDGFDNVEWSVGSVTVEGVVFSKCVLRYTISTQVWTVYDYVGQTITAMIYYDDGENINHIIGTSAGLVGALDVGYTDFGSKFYYEFIDRWRAYTPMYYKTKNISGFNVYHENAAGANLSYQKQKSGPNAWLPLGTIDSNANSLLPSASTDDFDVARLRIAGNTSGVQIVIHGIEITQLTIKGQETN